MEGNVWEWTETENNKTANTKGGSYRAFPEMMLSNFRLMEKLSARYIDLGFRVEKE